MKTLFFTLVLLFSISESFAQSISIDPNSLQLPRLAVSPTCAVADKGKMIYNTTQEKVLYCNGTTWIDPSTGGVPNNWVNSGNDSYLSNLGGRVGIGTNDPTNRLNIVYHGTAAGLHVKSTHDWAAIDIDTQTGDGALRYYKQGDQQWVLRNFNDNFQIYNSSASTPSMVFENGTGRIGIGTSSPVNVLDINGRARIRHNGATAGLWFNPSTNDTGGSDGAFFGMETNTSAGIFIGGSWRMRLSSTGNLTISGTLTESDQRLKKDIKKVENPLAKIEALSGYNYHWIATDRDPKLQAGVLAQEVEKVMPELVNEDSVGTKSVNYVGLIPYLIESVKELSKKNEILEKELNLLKNRK